MTCWPWNNLKFSLRTKRSSWHHCHAGSCLSRSRSDPGLNFNNSPWKQGHIYKSEEAGKTVIPERHGETLISSTGARRRLHSNAARIQLNQRLDAIRMLIVIVVTFAVLNVPFHVWKLCLNYLPSFDADSDLNHFLTSLTFLLMYGNCAISPILYAFLNKKFRQSFVDLIFKRRWRKMRQTMRTPLRIHIK